VPFVEFTRDYVGEEVVLIIPPGTYHLDDDNPIFHDGDAVGNIFAGIRKLWVFAYGAQLLRTTDNQWHMGSSGNIPETDDGVARIQTIYRGDDELTVVTPGEAAQFAVDDWVCISGIDLQGFGAPQNWMFFEYQQVASVVGDVITTYSGLKNDYLSTWPLYSAGGPGTRDYGGPATVYKMDPTWDMDLTVYGATFLNDGLIHNNVRNAKFVDCKFVGEPLVTVGQHREFDRCEIATAPDSGLWEFDKIVETCVVKNSKVGARLQISSSNGADYTVLENCTIGQVQGTSRHMRITDCRIGDIDIGVRFAGQCQELLIENSFIRDIGLIEAEKRDNNGAEPGDWGAFSGGIITTDEGPIPWAWPGAKVINLTTGDPEYGQDPFEVLSVTESAGDTVIRTTLPDPLPPDWVGDFVTDHPCPNLTVINSFGCKLIEDLSAGPNGVPLYSYASRQFVGLEDYDHPWDNMNLRVRGLVREIRINVIRAYSGVEASLLFRRTFGLNTSGGGGDDLIVNAKLAGERVITQEAGVIGAQTSDVLGDFADTWITNHIPFFELSADISSEDPDTWPIIKVTVHTDQGIIGNSHYRIPGVNEYIQLPETTAPSAPAANTARLFCRDNGSGVTQLCAIGPGGTIVPIVTLD
jgi:hypothetical protein